MQRNVGVRSGDQHSTEGPQRHRHRLGVQPAGVRGALPEERTTAVQVSAIQQRTKKIAKRGGGEKGATLRKDGAVW